MTPRILALGGSLRRDSFNHLLAQAALEGAKAAGAETTLLALRDLDIPMFDEDREKQGMPPGVAKLRELMKSHHGLLMSSPEYNSSISAALKNAIDWASRPHPGEPSLVCFTGKVAGLLAASPGGLGGIRGLPHLRHILGNIGVIVLPEQFALGQAHQAFDASGRLSNEETRKKVEAVGAAVARACAKLHG